MKLLIRVLLAGLIAAGSLRSVRAGDVSYYGIIKSQRFQQTNSTPPTALASNAFGFSAFVFASTNFAVTNATVTAPAPSPTPTRTLVPDSGGTGLLFDETFNTQSALDTAYPSGSFGTYYSFTVYATNDGVRSCTASFFGASAPPVPQVSNFAAAQQIDTRTNFTLTWNPLNGSSFDIVQVLVLGAASTAVFSSPAPFSSNALNGASTSVVIPAYALPPGSRLTGHLSIAKPALPSSSYPGATGIGALAKDTEFPLVTLPPAPPLLTVLSRNANPFVIGFTGESNRNYRLQGSTNLSTWLDLQLTNSPTGSGAITDSTSLTFTQRFYRIQVVR